MLLIYGSNILVITEATMEVLEVFHHQITSKTTGNMSWRVEEEGWEFTQEDLKAAGLWPLREYVRRRQATIAEYILSPHIFEFCTRAEQITGSSCILKWW